MRKVLLLPWLVLSVVAPDAGAQSNAPVAIGETANPAAQEQREGRRNDISLARIRSAADLDRYLRTHETSPLDALSEPSRKRFVESLVFTDQGLGSYRYRELEAELSPRQAFELLSLFGAQKTVAQLDFSHVD